ncbi:hypothetical protein V8E51_015823 [Hyaloscypha variabilis]
MSPKLYRHMKEVLGSRKGIKAPKDSSAPQTDNTALAISCFVLSSPPQILDAWLGVKWIFDLLERDTWQQGTTCDACANLSLLFSTGSRPNRPSLVVSKNAVQHHETFRKLAESSRTCGLCALLLACFKGFSRQHLFSLLKKERDSVMKRVSALREALALHRDNDYSSFRLENELYEMVEECYGSGKLVSELRITIQTSKWGFRSDAFHVADDVLRVYSEPEDVTASKVQGRPVSKTGGDPRTFLLAQTWIEDCYNNHPECRWSEDDNHFIESDPLLPTRIIDIGEFDQEVPRLILSNGRRGKWAALSHRWPQDAKKILRLVAKNIKGMQRAIPREALAATFQDALRIIRVLGLRYLWNAFVTIAAAATKDCLGGILGERDWVPASRPYKLLVDNENEEALGEVFIDFCIDRNHKTDAKTKTNNVNYLAYRAWCFQESLLSHRLLTFDRLQMRNTFLPSVRGPLLDDANALQSALQSWYNVLADYTNRNLTFPSDKLVAISGIANVVGSFMRDDYFAGLWRKSLPQSLLWSPYDEEDLPNPGYTATRSAQYRAPSWSWASVDSRISSFLCRAVPSQPIFATVLDISTELSGPDPYGQVKSGCLTIRGPLKKFYCGSNLSSWPQQPRLWWTPEGLEEFRDTNDISHCVFDYEPLPDGSPLWCLQITRIYGLVLLPRLGSRSSANEFTRVGIFHLRMRDVDNTIAPDRFSDDDVTTINIV